LLCRWVQATTSLPPPRHSLLRAEHHPSSGPTAALEGNRVQGRPIGASGAEDIFENAPRAEESDPRDEDSGPRDEDIVNPLDVGDKVEATPHLMEATPGSTVQLPCKIQASNLTKIFFFFFETSQQKL
jgi:hypothetical protein